MRLIQKALTFDDVLLVPAYSSILPKDTTLKTRLTRGLAAGVERGIVDRNVSTGDPVSREKPANQLRKLGEGETRCARRIDRRHDALIKDVGVYRPAHRWTFQGGVDVTPPASRPELDLHEEGRE